MPFMKLVKLNSPLMEMIKEVEELLVTKPCLIFITSPVNCPVSVSFWGKVPHFWRKTADHICLLLAVITLPDDPAPAVQQRADIDSGRLIKTQQPSGLNIYKT
jgi:hypothetical protein